MIEPSHNTDSDDSDEERRERYDDNQPTNAERIRDHFAKLDRQDRTHP